MERLLKFEVNRYALLFVLYWFLLLFSTTQILGKVGLLMPVFLGVLIFLVYAKLVLDARTTALYVICAFIAFWVSAFFKKSGEDMMAALTSTLLVVSNFGIAFLVAQFEKRKLYKPILLINVLTIGYIVFMRFMGFSVLDAISFIFQNSSYHLVAWLLFILNSIVILDLSNIGEKKKILRLTLTLFLALVVLQGRSGIVMGLFIVIYTCWLYYRKYFVLTIIISVGFALSGTFTFDAERLSFISEDLSSRGAKLGPREALYGCYLIHTDWTDLFFGFNKAALVGDCIYPIDPKSVGRTESSILSLISEVGIVSIILLMILVKNMKRSHRGNKMFLPIGLALLFRVMSADYLFSTVFDWFVYYLAFSYIFAPESYRRQKLEVVSQT